MISVQKVDTTAIPAIKELAFITWESTYKHILSEEQMDYMLTHFYSEASLEKQIKELHHQFILAMEDEVAVGYASYASKSVDQETYKLHKIYINPDKQGKGIGQTLIGFIITDIQSRGAK